MELMGTIIGIIVIAFIILFAIFSTKETIERKKEIKEFEKRADKAYEDAMALKENGEKITEIKNEEIKKQEEINNAETKEDLRAIARANAQSNNDRVSKQKETGSKNNTSTKTRKKSSESARK